MGRLNETLAWVSENALQGWDAAAVHYLQLHAGRWTGWVTPEASSAIERALESVSP